MRTPCPLQLTEASLSAVDSVALDIANLLGFQSLPVQSLKRLSRCRVIQVWCEAISGDTIFDGVF